MIQKNKAPFVLISSVIILLLLILVSISLGYANTSVIDVLKLISGKSDDAFLFIITNIRLPRIIVCIFGGASLGIAGLLLQTLTKNPLADSGILGINAGAGLVIALTIGTFNVSNPTILYFSPLFAMFGGLVTIFLIYLMSYRRNHNISPTRLIVTGIGISTIISGVMISIISQSNNQKMDMIVEWLSGKITISSWTTIITFIPILILLWGLAYSRSRHLNIMNLNEQTALALGLHLKKERIYTLMLTSSLAAISVVLIGNITFIGLLAGHLSRRLLGNNHKIILPSCLLIGAIILLVSDTIGRLLLVGTGIPTGLVVSIIGAPYFLWLMTKVD
ncbi:ferrichrome ABC transporter permease [Streptococcus agalactiae]|uniref:FecCD family ABC transporter permease n=1 Tax=Streptococcus agalactiae TaxID=1311 RepID=UPI0013751E08|nr:iron ABC transporter permease [Streptococcus agalactiae]KAF1174031.1 ferrichrome ABC transporter permease [Streptococcus agalactiae]KAF1180179.1 ferrichrome ABC transporter permease [Streptococcus agalactiae]